MLNLLHYPRHGIAGWLVLCCVMILVGCDDSDSEYVDESDANHDETRDVSYFHRVIRFGTPNDILLELNTGIDVNAPGPKGVNALMVAIKEKDLDKMELLMEYGADPDQTDNSNQTALRHAVNIDFVEGVRFLLKQGVDRGHHAKYPRKALNIKIDTSDIDNQKMPEDFKGFLTEAQWKKKMKNSIAASVKSMNEMGKNPIVNPILKESSSLEVQKLFLQAGEDLVNISNDDKRAIAGLSGTTEFQSSAADYRLYSSPRLGTKNPELIDNPFWRDMIRIGCKPSVAREHFDKADSLDESKVVWCFNRSESSFIQLKYGRIVQIGGRYEYDYDPDFHVYNDVVVHDGQGDFQIYGYPKDVFVPLNFLTAVLVGDWIYIIGGEEDPESEKPVKVHVYRLNVKSWNIETVKTTGEIPVKPIELRAIYERHQNALFCIINKAGPGNMFGRFQVRLIQEEYELDLETFEWRKLERKEPITIDETLKLDEKD